MSGFDASGTSIAGPPASPPGGSDSFVQDPTVLMGDEHSPSQDPTPYAPGADPHTDARAIVRLIQCQKCSLPLRTPLTLPCGNSLCRTCLPETYRRENISYPMTVGRTEGFKCPFGDCGGEHSVGDCSQDVTLSKVMERISIEVARSRPLTSGTPTLLDERLRWRNIIDSSQTAQTAASKVLSGGRLLATFTMAEIGELRYDSDVSYQTLSPIGDEYKHLDIDMLENLKEATKNEFDCQVCYALMLDPLTTPCGHSFCRKCVARILDHSTLCPICRRTLPMRPGVQHEASNKSLSKLLNMLCPEHVATREELAAQEEDAMFGERNVPLFVCTLAYPAMPTFLHIFEPRYRLMIRRAIESGGRKFGMMMSNRRGLNQGDLGTTQFMLYGTLLNIISIELLPDGRSLVETRGVSRFKVKEWGWRDGYMTGNVERVDDVTLPVEEQIEAQETSMPLSAGHDLIAQLDHMSTRDLLQIGTDFIARMRAASASWLHERVLAAYGSPPDDPALFPFWFASILPISDDEKYHLLPTTSVRERLKITARWVRRIEAQRWYELESWEPGHSPSADSESEELPAITAPGNTEI